MPKDAYTLGYQEGLSLARRLERNMYRETNFSILLRDARRQVKEARIKGNPSRSEGVLAGLLEGKRRWKR